MILDDILLYTYEAVNECGAERHELSHLRFGRDLETISTEVDPIGWTGLGHNKVGCLPHRPASTCWPTLGPTSVAGLPTPGAPTSRLAGLHYLVSL